ncbi:MAG: isochorismate synthase [Cryobacterium sp.]|nr:isochorismate synthase [Cryobacterium sp.]MBX3089921.1 isochorismate synthase [Cryobacterium sp.]
MGSTVDALPVLKVTTRRIDDPGSLLSLLPTRELLIWTRRGEGIVGFGETLRLNFSGPNRISEASNLWRELAAKSRTELELEEPGCGLVGFGSFSFADESPTPSALIIPNRIVGRRNSLAWMTTIEIETPGVPEGMADSVEAQRLHFKKSGLSEDGYRAAVSTALEKIRNGELEKVVLARDLLGRIDEDFSLRSAVDSLAHGYPDCWTFAVDDFFGSSPETLVQVREGAVSARVLAGSIARGADSSADTQASVNLVTSTKDQDEHEFAVQSVVAALQPHCSAVRASETPFTIRLPNLWHLASDVSGELADNSSSLDLAAALHPTAAVAGSPTASALDVIRELEPFDRGRYAGPVGWIDASGDGEWAIALRCAQIDADGAVRAIAGAGIVEGSVPENELAETSLKFRPIVEALGGVFG